jgi:hypothetical protein
VLAASVVLRTEVNVCDATAGADADADAFAAVVAVAGQC